MCQNEGKEASKTEVSLKLEVKDSKEMTLGGVDLFGGFRLRPTYN
jgi:hypothetical protein